MRYVGGKSRIATAIAEIINSTLRGGERHAISRREVEDSRRDSSPFGPGRTGGGLLLCQPFLRLLRRGEPGSRLYPEDPER